MAQTLLAKGATMIDTNVDVEVLKGGLILQRFFLLWLQSPKEKSQITVLKRIYAQISTLAPFLEIGAKLKNFLRLRNL